ncbi:MAG: hypothetical protein E1N59_270 [Puniceicoccaceae bacterium 5H]|nr:MAG: hypothetical protein E1N59_270 [Puniceicoccaceae bacterium 5H]
MRIYTGRHEARFPVGHALDDNHAKIFIFRGQGYGLTGVDCTLFDCTLQKARKMHERLELVLADNAFHLFLQAVFGACNDEMPVAALVATLGEGP